MSSQKGTELGFPYVSPGQMYAATTVLPVLGIALVALRMQRRVVTKAGLRIDDWLLLAALVC